MSNSLKILLALSFLSVNAFGSSVLNIPNSVSLTNISMSYWDIMLYVSSLLVVVSFIYLVYINIITIPDEHNIYIFSGEYNAKNIIEYIEKLESLFNRRFPKFKKSIEQCDKDTAGNIEKYSEIINSNLFCIKLNGRKRLTVFWTYSDVFLKIIILFLPIVVAFIVFISDIYYGLSGLILSIALLIFIIPLMMIMFFYFLEFSQYIFRKIGKDVSRLSLTLFAIDALINRNVERTHDTKTGDNFYYSIMNKYNNLVNSHTFLTGYYIKQNNPICSILEEYV